jgi:CIC family chloride channel protein
VFLHALAPSLVPAPASFVIVGMAGFFAAAAKTPFSTLVIVSEMTGNYNLLLPALLVCTLAFLLSDEQSIYSAQVEGRSHSPAHQGSHVRTVLAGLSVSQFMKPRTDLPALHADDPLATVLERLSRSEYLVLPVVDGEDQLLGVVSLEEVHLASQAMHAHPLLLAADLMRSDIIPLAPSDPLDKAQEFFVENDLLALPVVEPPRKRIVGMVRRFDVASAYLSRVQGQRVIAGDSFR